MRGWMVWGGIVLFCVIVWYAAITAIVRIVAGAGA